MQNHRELSGCAHPATARTGNKERKGGFGNSIIDLEMCKFISCYKGGTCAKLALFVL